MKGMKLFGFGWKQMLGIAVLAVVAILIYDQYVAPKISGVSAPATGGEGAIANENQGG